MTALLGGAFLAGLLGSPHCIGMCGGFAVACGGSARGSAAWNVGRLTTYAVLGAIAGSVGAILPGPPWVAGVVSGVLIVWFALVLGGWVAEPKIRIPGVNRAASAVIGRSDPASRFLFGLANGLLPCGLVYAALAIPVASGSALLGAASMVAFGLGTVPALVGAALGLRRLALRRLIVRRVLAVGVLLSGLWSIGMRQSMAAGGHGHGHGPPTMMDVPAPEADGPPAP